MTERGLIDKPRSGSRMRGDGPTRTQDTPAKSFTLAAAVERLPWFVAPLGIYIASRIASGVLIWLASKEQLVVLASLPGYHVSEPTGTHGYGDVVTGWDGQWYRDVAVHGYPDSPFGPDGKPTQTALGFYPLYPMLVRAVMSLTGADFRVVAPSVSLVAGAAAICLVYLLVSEVLDKRRAIIVTVLTCTFAAAPIMQTAYTESLALLWLSLALLLVVRRQYLAAAIPVLLLGVTRNIALALLPVVLWHWFVQLRHSRTRQAPPVPHHRLALLAASTLVAGGAWPLMTWMLTGYPQAYLTTMSAWQGDAADSWQPQLLRAALEGGAIGFVLVGLIVLLFAALLFGTNARSWGPELWAWSVSYPAYIAAASLPSARYLLLAFPLSLLWTPPTTSSAGKRLQNVLVVALAAGGIAMQWIWVSKYLAYTGEAGGWGFP